MQSRTQQERWLSQIPHSGLFWYIECKWNGKEYPLLVDNVIYVVPVGDDPSASRKVADMMRILHANETNSHTTWVALIHKDSLAGQRFANFYDIPIDIEPVEEYTGTG